MNLAPLANVVAYVDRRPSRLADVKRALDGRFDVVWSPVEGTVMATKALPRSVPDGDELRRAGFAFAEGRDTIAVRSPTALALSSLPGNVGFARGEQDRLVVVRSGPGTVPWYVWQDEERALVTTTFTELVRILPVALPLDPLVCGLWASLQPLFPDGRSFLRGVTAVLPGHTAEVRPGRPVRCDLWWDPWPEELPWPSTAGRADRVERFRDAVLSALDRELSAEPVNLLTLSGGVDSSSLAHLVRRRLGRPLAALSFVPSPDDSAGQLENSYLDPLVADLGITPHLRHPLDITQRLALPAGTPPVAFPVLHPALLVLPRLVAKWGVEVLVGGEFADEICGGWIVLPDWLDAVSLPRLITQLRVLPRGKSDVKAWARRRRPGRPAPGLWPASLPEFLRPEVDQEYQAWRADQLKAFRASTAPHRCQRAQLSWQHPVMAMNWEVCSFLGVRRSFPFLTAEVLEVVAACHPVELLGPGQKRLERQAFAGLVPDRYLLRPDEGRWQLRDDDGLIDPPPVPALLNAAVRQSLRPMSPIRVAGLMMTSRFAETLTKTCAAS